MDRNLVPAHVSLFHTLPGGECDRILDTLEDTCRTRAAFSMAVSGLRSLGRGVAFVIESDALRQLHSELAQAFREWLTPQDKQTFRPHITVQNKVTASQAKELLTILQTQPAPAKIHAIGVQLWRYLDGPWEPVARVPFTMPI